MVNTDVEKQHDPKIVEMYRDIMLGQPYPGSDAVRGLRGPHGVGCYFFCRKDYVCEALSNAWIECRNATAKAERKRELIEHIATQKKGKLVAEYTDYELEFLRDNQEMITLLIRNSRNQEAKTTIHARSGTITYVETTQLRALERV